MTDLDAKEVAWVAQLARRGEDEATITPDEPGLTEAWAAAEAALPEGWIVAGVDHVGPSPMMRREDFRATAWGPWNRSSRSVDATDAFGPTPAEALTRLAAALRSHTDG